MSLESDRTLARTLITEWASNEDRCGDEHTAIHEIVDGIVNSTPEVDMLDDDVLTVTLRETAGLKRPIDMIRAAYFELLEDACVEALREEVL